MLVNLSREQKIMGDLHRPLCPMFDHKVEILGATCEIHVDGTWLFASAKKRHCELSEKFPFEGRVKVEAEQMARDTFKNH